LLALGIDDVVAIDTEFCPRRGSPVIPVCLWAKSGTDDFCLRQVFATEAAFRSAMLLHNLFTEFQRDCRKPTYRQLASLRAQVFFRGALLR
jgi:hypothetical protein